MRSISKLSVGRLAGVVVMAALFIAACGSTPATKGSAAVVTFAEGPAAPPNYILPLASGSYFSVTNLSDFSQMMYLPLYWFGNNGEPTINDSLSVANPPTFSNNNKTVTITMKHWVWSNGKPITSRDVILWMNLLSAATDPASPTVGSSTAPGPGWGAEVAGGFPQNVVSYQATGTYSLVFHLNASYNPTWYTYNELSQIYPMPSASWDKTSASAPVGTADASAETRMLAPASDGLPTGSYIPKNPGTATSGALAVAQYLNLQSQDTGTYATNPLWQVVDGPFVLNQFTSSGFVKLVPNKNYSGSPKPTISAFELEPYTTDTAEFNALSSGALTIGYIPTQDLSRKSALEAQGYSYSAWNDFGIVYFPYNFTNPTSGPIFSQLYFRQAYQSLVNQKQYSSVFLDGTGTPNNGPVPVYPPGNPDASPLESGGQVYPYDPTKAVSLLKDNGWTVVPGGISSCAKPGTATGDCGKGIKAGQQLAFSLLYESGATPLANMIDAMQSTMKSVAGISLTLSQAPFSQVLSTVFAGCTTAKPCSTWDLATWGGGWVFSPDYYPTGGELFATGASSNGGDYSNATNDANIQATHVASSASAETAALFKYENYLAEQLPVVWMPNQPYQLTMYRTKLKGFVPQGVYDEIYPQMYTYTGG
ncbi:MAG TPA: ABC transporter substrate-binding protein [Candidatus Dormibacteraeota bacterium]|nr:ABC transporter substrate-binding protein [Candidatus Dormibacteraeota bacterium]